MTSENSLKTVSLVAVLYACTEGFVPKKSDEILNETDRFVSRSIGLVRRPATPSLLSCLAYIFQLSPVKHFRCFDSAHTARPRNV